MKPAIYILILSFIFGCKVTKPQWSKSLYNEQNRQSAYFAKRNYELRSKVFAKHNVDIGEKDTLFLIERLSIENTTAGSCFVWSSKRDTVIIYRETPISNDCEIRVLLSVDIKPYKEVLDSFKIITEQFDLTKISEETTFDGYNVFLSRITKAGVINVHAFDK